ncbi:hypothetical protein LXA47_14125, partial [Massilia sp. P8910]|uniref:hypothetical protein n=1 Tax=Massilia antarctica TaxID=2765360 RepID=UPI001E4087F2
MKALRTSCEDNRSIPNGYQDADLLAAANNRDSWIVSTREVDGNSVIVSQYGDDIWWFTGSTTNTVMAKTRVVFSVLPAAFRSVARELLYRFLTKGRLGTKRPGVA